jgi:hypothetical protein
MPASPRAGSFWCHFFNWGHVSPSRFRPVPLSPLLSPPLSPQRNELPGRCVGRARTEGRFADEARALPRRRRKGVFCETKSPGGVERRITKRSRIVGGCALVRHVDACLQGLGWILRFKASPSPARRCSSVNRLSRQLFGHRTLLLRFSQLGPIPPASPPSICYLALIVGITAFCTARFTHP